MKIKKRYKNNSEEILRNINPAIKWGLVISFFYSIFWWVLIENYQTLYITWLFVIFPTFYAWYTLIQKLKKELSQKAFKYAITLIFNVVILICYLITFNSVFLFLFIFCSIILAFFTYIPYLQIKYEKRISQYKIHAYHKSIFNSLLKDKNFLHHHNYYNSPKLRSIYKRKKQKENFKSFIISASIIPIFILLWWVESLLNWNISWLWYLWMFFVFFWIMTFSKILGFSVKYILGKNKWDKISIYQKKIDVDKHITYRKKIFFY